MGMLLKRYRNAKPQGEEVKDQEVEQPQGEEVKKPRRGRSTKKEVE